MNNVKCKGEHSMNIRNRPNRLAAPRPERRPRQGSSVFYDLGCSKCGSQLHFRGTSDMDGDKLLLVDLCSVCLQGSK